MSYKDSSQAWNADTVGIYPDLDRDRRLDAIEHGRVGGFTVESLRSEQARRDLYLNGGWERQKQLLTTLLEATPLNHVYPSRPQGSGETPQ